MFILAQEATGMTGFSLIWIVVMLVVLYFMMIRPQQKETKRKNAMLSELAVGDTILTTSGFYGMVIDITEDTIIVFPCRNQPLHWWKNQKMQWKKKISEVFKTLSALAGGVLLI